MATLAKRANKRQRQMLRIIEGAVKCASQAHRDWPHTEPRFARSVAKRATGTLSAFERAGTLATAVSAAGATQATALVSERSKGGHLRPRPGSTINPIATGQANQLAIGLSQLHHAMGIAAEAARKARDARLEAELIRGLRFVAHLSAATAAAQRG